jgi:hypothetical protein
LHYFRQDLGKQQTRKQGINLIYLKIHFLSRPRLTKSSQIPQSLIKFSKIFRELWKRLSRNQKALIIPLNPLLEKGDSRWVSMIYQRVIFNYPPFLKGGQGGL